MSSVQNSGHFRTHKVFQRFWAIKGANKIQILNFVAPKTQILSTARVNGLVSFIDILRLFIICIRLSLFRVQSDFGQGRTVAAIFF